MALDFHPDDFPCIDCAQHFNSRERQVAHLQIVHGAARPWLCYHCATAMENVESLREHQRIHSKGFNQCHCGFTLSTADLMARHQKFDHQGQTHRATRGCERCSYVNDSRVAVSLHMLHHHPERCEYCLRIFKDEVDLRVHKNQGFGGVCPTKVPEPAIEPETKFPSPESPPPACQDSPLTTEASLPIHPQDKYPLQLDPLPDFASIPQEQNIHKVTAADFDPTRTYDTTASSRSTYRYCPPQVSDSRLLNADPKMLAYGNLLRLAKTMTNREIMDKANEHRPQPVFASVQMVAWRIQAAYREEARIFTDPKRGLYTEVEEVRVWLEGERRRDGIVNGRRVGRTMEDGAREGEDDGVVGGLGGGRT